MAGTDTLTITTAAERPELIPRVYEIDETWPAFIPHDLVAGTLLDRVVAEFPQYCAVATDGDRVVARALAVPFDAHADGREETPDQGWDQVLSWAFHDLRRSAAPTAASALEITVDTRHLGRGLSYRMLNALRSAAERQGHTALLAPVRPTAKHLLPRLPMAEYLTRTRTDGLPEDPWLRVHVKAGGSIVKVAPASMTVSGSLEQWRQWTGLPFDRDGGTEVPGALVPVHTDLAQDRAVYVEPNVWVRHPLRPVAPIAGAEDS